MGSFMGTTIKLATYTLLTAGLSALAHGSVSANDHSTEAPSLDKFKACVEITDNASRLACFDKAASNFDFASAQQKLKDAAKAKAKIVILEKAAAKVAMEKASLEKRNQEKLLTAQKAVKKLAKLEADAEKLRQDKEALIEADKARIAGDRKSEIDEFGFPTRSGTVLDQLAVTVLRTKKSKISGIFIYLESGAIWKQTDDVNARSIRKGDTLTIKRGKLGGFRIIIDKNSRAFRAKRILPSK